MLTVVISDINETSIYLLVDLLCAISSVYILINDFTYIYKMELEL